jgi:multiple sugar transport system permease protein
VAAAEAAPTEGVPAQKEETWSSKVPAAAKRTGEFALAAAVGLYGAWMLINAVYVIGLLFFRESAPQQGAGGAETRLGTRIMYVLAGVVAALLAGLLALRAGMDLTRVSFFVVAAVAVLLGLVVERKYLVTWVAVLLAALAVRALHGAGILGLGLISWATALAIVVPSGILITWVVLRLGYFKGKATITTLVFFTLFGLTMIIPFLWMISTAFKTQEATSLFKVQWLAWPIRWANFYDVFSRVPYARFYLNSIFLASYVTIGLVFTSSLAAYSFARLEFPGRDKIFMAYLGTMMIPSAVTSIPVFVLMCKIGWVDSYKAIIIPGIFSAYGTFMLRQFFMTLPSELEDAAKIDGCSLFGIFYRIILPLSKAAVATLTIFTFMGSWGDFMWPLIILNDPNKMPLPVGLQFFARAETPDPNVLMCASMLMILPVIIVFLLGQRYFVEGIQLGAIKG